MGVVDLHFVMSFVQFDAGLDNFASR